MCPTGRRWAVTADCNCAYRRDQNIEVVSNNRCKKQQLRAGQRNRLCGARRAARPLNSHEVIAFDFSKQKTALVQSDERRSSGVR